ncbi:HlyD family secretion protein [uncultured Brevibacillus sp.]|uniref:HlyD family secretion protein n=1 Tax=uncultured Brevibacillus sp. TaxID=169970 RepID=UPI0025966EB0|nr:biotin/lipoyl-binding protein [uncultured Brevibacillus sp.]
MKRNLVFAGVLVICLIGGGFLLTTNGKDAVSVAAKQKESILTAEQVNISFQQVGGRVTQVEVQEEQRVKKGDVLMLLDPTDLDLQIAKAQKELEQMDVKITQIQDSVRNGGQKVTTQELQARLGVESAVTSQRQINKGARDEDLRRQEIVVKDAHKSLENTQLTYDRTKKLFDEGAVAKASLDSAETALSTVQNTLAQQEEILKKLKAGATAEERQQASIAAEKAKTVLSQVEQARDDLMNNAMNADILQKQKEAADIQLKTLQTQRERMTLKAPQDGKVIKVVPKVGENVAIGSTVVLLETDSLFYDIYVSETQVPNFKVGAQVRGHVLALNEDLTGDVRFITAAPQFANLRMSREKGQADLSSFQVRVYLERVDDLLPGMTVEVKVDEIPAR